MPPSYIPYGMIHILLITLILVRGAHAYTWSFKEAPSQCGHLTVAIAGNDGIPPFHVLITPFGPSPLAHGVETRQILDIPFTEDQNEVQFQLTYPAGSQFIAVASDASGFASGGTGIATTVADSDDSSCFDTEITAHSDFVFNISPSTTQIVQCQALGVWWDPTTVQGRAKFLVIIPGGHSHVTPKGVIPTPPMGSTGLGFSWTPSLRAGTTFLLMGGDSRGNGTGGVVSYVVALGNNDSSCLSENSPSSTPGSSAEGRLTTQTEESRSGKRRSASPDYLSLMAGGFVGGCAAVLLWLLVFRRAFLWLFPEVNPRDLELWRTSIPEK